MMGTRRVVLKSGTRPPWVGLAAAVWVETAAGNTYNFPLYSPLLKSALGLSQQQLTILGVANDLGESVSLLPGIACNKFPPWAVLLVGTLFCFLGYGLIWLAVTQSISNLPFWSLFIILCVATNSAAWFGTAVLVTNMRNFPLSRGTVAGILKGYVGISAAVYTVIYSTVLEKSSSNLLLFLALGIPVLSLTMMYFVRACEPALEENSSLNAYFLFTQAFSVIVAIYLLATTIVSDAISLSNAVSYTLVAIMAVLLLSPLAIPIKMTLFPAIPKHDTNADTLDDNPSEADPLLASLDTELDSFYNTEDGSDVDLLLAIGEGAVKQKRRPRRGEDFRFREAIVKADFWLLWLVYFLGVGSGVTVLNNLSQIGVALGFEDTTILLALFSFCNFLGRLGSGAVSEYFVRSRTMPRTVWMTCSHAIMILVFLLYASAQSGTLYAATALLGICYGVHYSMMVPTASELFGLKHFGVIYSFMLLGNPIGAILFSALLAGFVYDAEAAKQGVASTCSGQDCFRLTFQVLAGVCGLGTLLGIVLTFRIRPVYQMLYAGGSFRLPQSASH